MGARSGSGGGLGGVVGVGCVGCRRPMSSAEEGGRARAWDAV